MEPTFTARRALVLRAATLCAGFDARAEGARSQPLFVIARGKTRTSCTRSTRATRRQTRSRRTGDHVLGDARRERTSRALSWLERKLAYGFTTTFEPGGDALRLVLKAFSRGALA